MKTKHLRHRRVFVVAMLAAAACGETTGHDGHPAHLGYTAATFKTEDALERRFRDAVSAEQISAFHRAVTARPHMAGTPGGAAVADSIRQFLTHAGLDVEVREYSAYLSHPREIAASLVTPDLVPLLVTEPSSSLDPDTQNHELGPGFIAYSASGNVTAPVVYVNYGLPADYAELTARKISVKGKLVLARYGKSHRAVKLYTAEQQGAAGIMIYSDPADDGFLRGDTWPSGYWRTSDQLQRGNGKYSWYWHGDPLTPGGAANAQAARLDPAKAPTLPKIPAIVLSWGQASKIFDRLDGPEAPESFRGGLPLKYRLGDGIVRVQMRVVMDAHTRTIRDIIARVPGARLANRGVLFGTHHDAWTFGGTDPGTGVAAMLELARGLGALRGTGWKPERTITIAFWDAEEFGLIGSTEYAEDRQRDLRDGTICYINTDLYMNGRFDPGGVPSLRDFLVEVAKDVPDSAGTLYDAWRASEWSRQTAVRKEMGDGDFEVELKALGSGADFVPFQDYLGLPTLSVEFNATGGYTFGPYHSNYDTRRFVERVVDPGFVRGAQLVRLLGTIALRMTESQVLPFRFSHYADRMTEYVDVASRWTPDTTEHAIPLDLTLVRASVGRAADAARNLEEQIDNRLMKEGFTPEKAAQLNDLLAKMEQRLLDESSTAQQRWYRHVIYGWDIYSLYDGQPFPGLAEAVRLKDAARVQREVGRIIAAVDRFVDGLHAAGALVSTK